MRDEIFGERSAIDARCALIQDPEVDDGRSSPTSPSTIDRPIDPKPHMHATCHHTQYIHRSSSSKARKPTAGWKLPLSTPLQLTCAATSGDRVFGDCQHDLFVLLAGRTPHQPAVAHCTPHPGR